MYSCTCFMAIVTLLLMDVRIGALQENDLQPTRCYKCNNNDTTSCEESSSWTTVTCPKNRPLCATTIIIPDFHSSLVCAPVAKTTCTVRASFNSSFEVTWVCNSHLCNTPLLHEWRNELKTYINSSEIIQANICELLSKYRNNTQKDTVPKGLEITEASTTVAKSSSESTAISVTSTLNMRSILRDSERPRAEPLKQEPTVPSDDDEDESEGSGTYEDSKVRNNAVSAPAAPNSLLPANENKASVLYKDLLLTTLFISSYLLV